MSLTDEDIRRITEAIKSREIVCVESRYLSARSLLVMRVRCIDEMYLYGDAYYAKTASGAVRRFQGGEHYSRALHEIVSVRTLDDFPAPVPDDRPAEVIPEDYYACL